jgi:hypothetical protein
MQPGRQKFGTVAKAKYLRFVVPFAQVFLALNGRLSLFYFHRAFFENSLVGEKHCR